ncbi:hypothetical protein [Geobacillus stearothermophilus]|nr:hypothetical protein [Geobacillus stearothermophilus]
MRKEVVVTRERSVSLPIFKKIKKPKNIAMALHHKLYLIIEDRCA